MSWYTTIEPEPPISLNGDWRLWSCLVAMAASAFTFSPHSVEDARCSLRTETARLSEETRPISSLISLTVFIAHALVIQPSTSHIVFCVLLAQCPPVGNCPPLRMTGSVQYITVAVSWRYVCMFTLFFSKADAPSTASDRSETNC